jgi:long-chain fatty acid transport protein
MRGTIGACGSRWLANRFRFLATAGIAVCFVGISQSAQSAGFLNNIQSAGAASVSTAGETAIAEDATTVYYNPAGMTSLNRPEILLSAPIISLSNSFVDGGTRAALGEPAHGSGGNKDEVFPLPSLFAMAPLSNRFSVGLGVFIPFGQVNEYADKWVGRY